MLVVDNLQSTSASAALSANMGRVLNESKYEKPLTGIPKTDLASDVQASLNAADSSVHNSGGSSGGVLIKASNNSNVWVMLTDTMVVLQGRSGSVTIDSSGVSVQAGNSGFPDAKMYYNGLEVATKNLIPYDAGGATS